MLRMIALDLDGTLLHTNKGLTKRTQKILEQYIQCGTHIVIASGRSYASLPQDVLDIPGIDYLITSNGAAVVCKSTGEKLFHFPLKPSCAHQLLTLLKKTNTCFEIFIDGIPYAPAAYVQQPILFGASEHAVAYIQRTRRPVKDLYTFADQHIHSLDCIDFITSNAMEKQQLLLQLQAIPDIYITSSVPYLLEISDRHAGKGAAVRMLAEYFDILPEQIAAFGNEENDMDMIAFAGIGVAVANSPEHVKAIADYVAQSNDEDGVAIFLEQLLQDDK